MSSSKEEKKVGAVNITTLTQLLKIPGAPAAIFNKLSAEDLSRSAAVSRDFNNWTKQKDNWKRLYNILVSGTNSRTDFSMQNSSFDYREEYLQLLQAVQNMSFEKYWTVEGYQADYMVLDAQNEDFWKKQIDLDFSESSQKTSESKEKTQAYYHVRKYYDLYQQKIKNFIQLTLFIKSISEDSFTIKITPKTQSSADTMEVTPIKTPSFSEHFPVDNILSQYKFSFDFFYEKSFFIHELLENVTATRNQKLLNYLYSLAKQRYVDISKTDEHGRSLLYWSVVFNQPIAEIDKLLAIKNRNKDEVVWGESLLAHTLRHDHWDLYHHLNRLKAVFQVNENLEFPNDHLLQAVTLGSPDIVKNLAQKNPAVIYQNYNQLFFAAVKAKQPKTLEILLKQHFEIIKPEYKPSENKSSLPLPDPIPNPVLRTINEKKNLNILFHSLDRTVFPDSKCLEVWYLLLQADETLINSEYQPKTGSKTTTVLSHIIHSSQHLDPALTLKFLKLPKVDFTKEKAAILKIFTQPRYRECLEIYKENNPDLVDCMPELSCSKKKPIFAAKPAYPRMFMNSGGQQENTEIGTSLDNDMTMQIDQSDRDDLGHH
jgi:hypothetical protein